MIAVFSVQLPVRAVNYCATCVDGTANLRKLSHWGNPVTGLTQYEVKYYGNSRPSHNGITAITVEAIIEFSQAQQHVDVNMVCTSHTQLRM